MQLVARTQRIDQYGLAGASEPQGVPLSWLLRLCAGAEAQGIARDSLFAESLIELRYGDDRDQVSPAQHLLLCMNTARSIDDAMHGLSFQRVPSGYSGMSLRVMLGCSTLEVGIRAVEKLYGLASTNLRLALRIAGDAALLTARCEARTESASLMLEDISLSWLYVCCSHFVGRPLPVTEVVTRDQAHMNLGRLHWAAKAPVRHGSTAALRFSKGLLTARRAGHAGESAHWECLRPWLQYVEPDRSMPQLLALQNEASALRLDGMARRAGVSASTLRRRLRDSHGGIRRLRRSMVAEAGIALLRSSDASVEAVAAELGYADARSFRRFLKSATGHTPHEIRGSAAAAKLGSQPAVHERIRQIAALLDQ
jgi:AraC-like DNA-binding protein